ELFGLARNEKPFEFFAQSRPRNGRVERFHRVKPARGNRGADVGGEEHPGRSSFRSGGKSNSRRADGGTDRSLSRVHRYCFRRDSSSSTNFRSESCLRSSQT